MTPPAPNPDAERVKEILEGALDRPADEREAYIRAQTEGRADLGERVLGLLGALEGDEAFMGDVTLPADASGELGATPGERLAEHAGDTIGRYRLLEQIGEGGFGVVFMARQTEPVRRDVALKIIKLGLDTKQVVRRFEAERQALAMMDHPNIARVFDGGATATGRPYFVMELVRGVPITDYCKKHELDLEQRLELFAEVCSAVQHAHLKGIIHRDIKPTNVLVTVVDSRPVPKVIDFGIAKATSARLTEQTLFTEFRQLVGTPEYMSPEQADTASADIDTRTDIYSLGVLLYELLTGATPFEPKRLRSAAIGELQRIIREEEPPRPSTRLNTLRSGGGDGEGSGGSGGMGGAAHPVKSAARLAEALRGELDWIIMRAIDKDRTRRYETAASFARDVGRYLAGQPIEARPASTAYRLSKFARRHKRSIAAGTAIGAALVLGLVASLIGLAEANQQARIANDNALEAQKQTDIANANYEEARVVTNFLSRALQSADPSKKGKDVKVVEILDDAALTLESPAFVASELAKARLHHTLTTTYLKLGFYEKAEHHAREALAIRLRELGPQNVDTLEIEANLVSVIHIQGRIDEAEPLSDSLIERLERLMATDEKTARSVYFGAANTHGLIKRARRDLDTALKYERAALDEATVLFGPDHPKTIGILQNIATTLRELGRTDESMEVALDSIERSERALGHDARESILSREALANVYFYTGQHDRALPIYEENIAARKRKLGEDHPSTLTSTYNLAAVYFMTGHQNRAVESLLEIMRYVPEKLAYTHQVAMSAAALAGPRYIPADGAPPPDEDLARRILTTIKANINSPYFVQDFGNDAASALIFGRSIDPEGPGRALTITTAIVDTAEREQDPDLYAYLDTHAHALYYSGRVAEAVEAQRRSLTLCPEDQPEARAEIEKGLAMMTDARGG